MEANKQRKSYWRDIFFQASGNTIAQLIGILGIPLLTRIYTPEIFALQSIFIQTVVFLAAFVSFRYEYFVLLLNNKFESYVLIKWILSIGFLMITLLTFIVFLIDVTNVFNYFNIYMQGVFYLAPITSYLICISIAFQHEAQRQGDFYNTALAEVHSKIGYILSGSVLYLIIPNMGLFFTTGFGAVGKLYSLRKYIKEFLYGFKKIKSDNNFIFKYKSRSKGMVASNTLLAVSGLLPILFISKKYDVNSLGQFSLVLSTVFLPSGLIGSAVGSVFYQRSAQFFNAKEFSKLKEIWKETLIKLFSIAFPAYLLIYFVSPWVYPLAFGDQWEEAGEISRIMSVAAFFSFLAGPLDRMSLVLGIGYYLPLIHTARLLMVILTLLIASYLNLFFIDFIFIFSIGSSIVYFFDIIACRFYLSKASKYL